MSTAVGIDLGTTNTVVAAVRDGVAFTIADPQGRRLIPSTVSFHPSGNVLVGYPAVDRRLIDPENTIYSVKRLIGRSWSSEEVQRTRPRLPFAMKEGPKSGIVVEARGEEYTLPEISAFVLRYAKATAEAALGVPVDRAVITVPANFNDLQRAATKVAGKLAGLDVLRILNEPTAAALAYGQGAGQDPHVAIADASGRRQERVAVYDLGGGTFDITLLDLSGAVFEVLATAGDMSLGGDDFDNLIADRMVEEMLKKHRYDPRTNPTAIGTLRMVAESLKRELSTREDVSTQVNDVGWGPDGKPLSIGFKMTRTELEWASLALVDRTFQVCQTALERASMNVDQVDRVILVGGSTRMPLVARRVEQFFKKPPVMRVNPDEVVALGAAMQAHALDHTTRRRTGTMSTTQAGSGRMPAASIAEASIVAAPPLRPPQAPAREEPPMPELPLVTPLGKTRTAPPLDLTLRDEPPAPDLAMGDLDAELPPPAAAPKPPPAPPARPPAPPAAARPHSSIPPANFGRPLVFDMLEKLEPTTEPVKLEMSGALPPPAARAAQAARAAVVSVPPPKPPLLIDVTPLSLNVETVGGFCDALIEANTPVPCDRTRIFLTASDMQTSVSVRVAQGESKKFAENTFLGELVLSGIAAQRRGEAHIAVTFEIDADGILNVRAKDVKTGQETRARMQLVGTQNEEHELAAMHDRQARHAVG